jgi:methylglutaconyl-CoA hydratase
MESYPPQELDTAVLDWVQLLSLNGPQAMRATKALLQEVGSGELSAELRRSSQETIAHVRISVEGQEGLQAFLQRRPPAWQEPLL